MFKLVVLFSVVALGTAKPAFITPITYTAVPAVSSLSQYSSSVVHGSPLYASTVYRTPYITPAVTVSTLSQAPNTPAVVIDAVNGVPLDTPEVVAARAAHIQAKDLSGVTVHSIRKRSIAPLNYNTVVSPLAHVSYSAPYVTTYSSPVLSPVSFSAVVPKTYGVHPW